MTSPSESGGLRVVVIGASAGGVQALRQILADLPHDLAAAVLVVQHIERDRVSRLAQVLGWASVLPVTEAVGGERIVAGHVYVAPPDRHLTMDADERVVLADTPAVHFSRPAADELFASVARQCGERAVAVVLTGFDGDGTEGVRVIKEHGGIVLVQDPAGAVQPSMPRGAIATGTADHVIPVGRIASFIQDIVSRPVSS
ncbi:MAG TPA: chemotaxis protein CheB [Longimicrobium sp.]|nr:chemotaxis protein CheB [Longimicrobium sp.]